MADNFFTHLFSQKTTFYSRQIMSYILNHSVSYFKDSKIFYYKQISATTITSTCTVPVLSGVTLVSGSLFTYNYGTPTNCLSLVLAYSRDKINWVYDTVVDKWFN